jgi:Family of unknown function (DUF6788)
MSTHLKKARSRKNAIARRLPDPTQILRASLVARYTQCGKPGCKCMRGEKHGPSYCVSVTMAAGKTKQLYVRKEDLNIVKQWIDNYDKLWQGLMEISEVNFELLRTQYPDRRPKPQPRQEKALR